MGPLGPLHLCSYWTLVEEESIIWRYWRYFCTFLSRTNEFERGDKVTWGGPRGGGHIDGVRGGEGKARQCGDWRCCAGLIGPVGGGVRQGEPQVVAGVELRVHKTPPSSRVIHGETVPLEEGISLYTPYSVITCSVPFLSMKEKEEH